jgi:hypothetical protein
MPEKSEYQKNQSIVFIIKRKKAEADKSAKVKRPTLQSLKCRV